MAGLVAGGITASTALSGAGPRHAGSSRLATVLAAPAAAAPVASDNEVDAHDFADALRARTAIVDWEGRPDQDTRASRSTNTPGSLVRPTAGGTTGWFGERRGSRAHSGTDYDGDTGDPVAAAGTGTVVHAGAAPAGYGGYGLTVLIDHGNGVTTLYAHLSRVAVQLGQSIAPGDVIGAIGTTGNVTGSHLHFEVRVGGHAVDPADWVAS